MRENRPKWFGHVIWIEGMKAVRVIIKINVERQKERRTKKGCLGTAENEMRAAGLLVGDVRN